MASQRVHISTLFKTVLQNEPLVVFPAPHYSITYPGLYYLGRITTDELIN